MLQTGRRRCGKHIFASLFFAFLASYAASLETAAAANGAAQVFLPAGRGVLQLLFFILAGMFFYTFPVFSNKRRASVSFVTGFLFSAAFVCGYSVERYQGLFFGKPLTLLTLLHFGVLILGYTAISGALICAAFAAVDGYKAKNTLKPKTAALSKGLEFLFSQNRRSFLLITAAFIVCWLPYYIVFFPGTIAPDSYAQLQMGVGEIPITAANPALLTYFWGAVMAAGKAVFGSYYAGAALLASVQMLGTALAFAFAIHRMGGWGVAAPWQALSFAFFAFIPTVASSSILLLKDSWQGPAALVYCVLLIELCRAATTPQNQIKHENTKFLRGGVLVLFALLVVFMKNTGVVCWTVSSMAAFISLKGKRVFVLLCSAACAMVILLVTGPVFRALHVEPISGRDSLSLPALQVARVAAGNTSQLSERQRELIARILPYEELKSGYERAVAVEGANPVKDRLNMAELEANPALYADLYFELGAQFPREYVETAMFFTRGYWYPASYNTETMLDTYDAYVHYREGGSFDTMAASYTPRFAPGKAPIPGALNILPHLPLTFVLFSLGFMFWLLVFCGAYLIYGKVQTPYWAALSFSLASWVVCLFSPVNNHFRYAYPLVLATPLFTGLVFFSKAAKAAAQAKAAAVP